MPLFGKDQTDDTATWEPQAADGRLAQTAGASAGGVFTSDLSVSEYVLLGEAGFEPLGFVVGSSIYHIGLQNSKWGQNMELTTLTQAMYNARELAMSRMEAEAAHLGADGIVGVELARRVHETVVHGERLPVELSVLDFRRGLDELPGYRQAHDVLRVVGVGERRRDGVAVLFEVVLVLDDQEILVGVDDLAERLVVVVGEDFIPLHGLLLSACRSK